MSSKLNIIDKKLLKDLPKEILSEVLENTNDYIITISDGIVCDGFYNILKKYDYYDQFINRLKDLEIENKEIIINRNNYKEIYKISPDIPELIIYGELDPNLDIVLNEKLKKTYKFKTNDLMLMQKMIDDYKYCGNSTRINKFMLYFLGIANAISSMESNVKLADKKHALNQLEAIFTKIKIKLDKEQKLSKDLNLEE